MLSSRFFQLSRGKWFLTLINSTGRNRFGRLLNKTVHVGTVQGTLFRANGPFTIHKVLSLTALFAVQMNWARTPVWISQNLARIVSAHDRLSVRSLMPRTAQNLQPGRLTRHDAYGFQDSCVACLLLRRWIIVEHCDACTGRGWRFLILEQWARIMLCHPWLQI